MVEDPRFVRPAEVEGLVGDASKARAEPEWEPRTGFRELIAMMVDSDLERLPEGGSEAEVVVEQATREGAVVSSETAAAAPNDH